MYIEANRSVDKSAEITGSDTCFATIKLDGQSPHSTISPNATIAKTIISTKKTSPLRYPGGKSRFTGLIADTLNLNNIKGGLCAEPFAGGASVSLFLLESGIVDKIALNDADPLIAAFWSTVFSDDAAWLAEQVLTAPIDIHEWQRQKQLVPHNRREAALKCIYLNRTSYNGIIYKAGPMGGRKQHPNSTLGQRFNQAAIAKRILELSKYATQVTVTNLHWQTFLDTLCDQQNVLVYLDPPYVYKADQLYGLYFNDADHVQLRDYLKATNINWLLSYDDVDEVRNLYKQLPLQARKLETKYSSTGGLSTAGYELLYSNLKNLPAAVSTDHQQKGVIVRNLETEPAPVTESNLATELIVSVFQSSSSKINPFPIAEIISNMVRSHRAHHGEYQSLLSELNKHGIRGTGRTARAVSYRGGG